MSIDIPLIDASETQLADAVEANLFALFRATAELMPDAELVESDRLNFQFSPVSNAMFTAVWRVRLAVEETDAVIERTLDWFKARSAPAVYWWLTGQTKPADLPQRLQEHGFTPNYIASPGMVADIELLPQQVPTPDGFTMKRVEDEQTMEEWFSAFCGAYPHIPPEGGRTWVDATLAIGIHRAPWQMYVGYWNGQPVATNMVYYGAGVAGMFIIGTVPEMRGKGIGSAITLKPLWDARALGYRYGVLFASKMGYPVYQRLGFREIGVPFGRYMWQNDSFND